jgi:hypothetical protein
MSPKPRPRSIAEQREQLDRVIASKLRAPGSLPARTKSASTPIRTNSSRPG